MNVPLTVVPVGNLTVPVLMVALLNVMALLPFTVPAPTKFTVPVVAVTVPLLVKVPAAEIFKVPATLQLKVPVALFVNRGVVIAPAAPKVTTPLLVTEVEAVIEPAALFTLNVMPLLTVIVAGGVPIAVEIFKLCAIVVFAPVGGTEPPNHDAAVAQSVAPVWVM